MKKLVIAITGLIVGVASLGFLLQGILNPKPRVIANEKAAFLVPADELQYFFASNAEIASEKYLDQVLEVSGEVTEVAGKSIVLDNRVMVNFLTDTLNGAQEGEELIIKGRCVGFDELLLQVKIDQAQINSKQQPKQ
ncbi:hypothetical protein [Flagellimonas marina]|uniref:tRNA_anti-like n=1 Tax=Flagellimonas marina TaxID=1775168 RepID=A0ABV8PJ57_9FLAO